MCAVCSTLWGLSTLESMEHKCIGHGVHNKASELDVKTNFHG